MQSLNHLVANGKVLYLGVSDTPAWVVVKCNEYARAHGLRQFSVYQGRWSAAERDFEREILPMTKAEGMGLCPWGVLGGGYFKAKGHVKEGGRNLRVSQTGKDEQVSEVLEKIANAKGTLITSVALAYILHKTSYVFPICGGRKVDHLKGNIEALGLELSQEDMDEIESAYDFSVGFPGSFLSGGNPKGLKGPQDVSFTSARANVDWVINDVPIKPHKD